MMAPFLEALGAALETVAEGAAEAESVEAVEGLEDGIELPDDSGDRVYHSELPDDSGEKPPKCVSKIDVNESDYLSTYEDRIAQTPNEAGARGQWTGIRGESKFVPNDVIMQEIMKKFNLDGIEYNNAVPDFSPCSECTVEIGNMTENRKGAGNNFDQCDHKCAEKWSKEYRDGKSDWTANDVRKWRDEHGYSWHERNDMKTCDLIPTKVNDYFGHLGGVGECRRRDALTDFGGEFDE